MPTRPISPDPSGDTPRATPFGGLGAGLDFFQDWLKAAGSALPNLQGSAASTGMSSWALPTLDPEELDKRIQDLKTVQFWLEQNARMIAMTIQGLEVQKMTLSTLKGMNVSMDSLRDALKARNTAADNAAAAASAAASAAPPEPEPSPTAPPETAAADNTELINPMRWWDTLTEQFTHLASQASQTAQSVGTSMSDLLAQTHQGGTESSGTLKPSARTAGPRAATAGKAPARKAASRRSSQAASKTPAKAPVKTQAKD